MSTKLARTLSGWADLGITATPLQQVVVVSCDYSYSYFYSSSSYSSYSSSYYYYHYYYYTYYTYYTYYLLPPPAHCPGEGECGRRGLLLLGDA